MAKLSKALVVQKPKTLAKAVDVEVLPPSKNQLATRSERQLATREKGQLTTVNKRGGSTTVVNSGAGESETQVARRRRNQDDSSPGKREETSSALKGVTTLSAAASVAANFISPGDIPAFHEGLNAVRLNFGNKRKKQPLAAGGYVHRRLGGTGFDGAKRLGGRKVGRALRGEQSAKRPTSTETKTPSRRERAKALPDRERAKALPGREKPLALGDKAKPLALGDKPRSKSASGLAAEPLVIPEAGIAQKKVRSAIPFAGAAVDTIKDWRDVLGRDTAAVKRDRDAFYLKVKDVKAAVLGGKFQQAIDMVFSSASWWKDEKDLRAAERYLEGQLK